MAAQLNTNVIALQLEKVRDKIPLLYERDDILLAMIQQRGDVEQVSTRNMRLPLQVLSGGKAGAYSPDGGDLGRGSGTDYEVAQVTPLYFRFAVELSTLVKYATNSKEKAIENAVKREVANGMKQFRAFLDMLCQTAGNGVIGTISSVASNVFTMSVPFGAALVYNGQTIQVYNAALATNRGTANVTNFDPVSATQTVTVDAAPGGTIATDVLVATSGTWLGLNRATFAPLLTTPSVNAGSAALTPGNVRLAINKVRKALGVDAVGKLIAYMNVEQEHAWENLGITVSEVIKEGGGGRANDLDLLFTGKKTMAGLPIKVSIHADQTRIDFIDLSHWGRAVTKDIGYFEDGEGKTVFPIYGASGGIAAA
ncbi:MAG: hypothetical protein DMG78_28335, partial [Acidobacteria bacterium]